MAEVNQIVGRIEQDSSITGQFFGVDRSTFEGLSAIEAIEAVTMTVVAGAALARVAKQQERNIVEFQDAGSPPEEFMKGFGWIPLQVWGPIGVTHLAFKGAKAAAGLLKNRRS